MKHLGGFLAPQRAEHKILPAMLDGYEKRGWWAQVKKNGTNSIIEVLPDGNIRSWNRHGEPHKQWQFSDGSRAAFLNLPKGHYVFNAELLHSKTPHIKDVNYLHDLLVFRGEHLIGVSYTTRYELLMELFRELFLKGPALNVVDPNMNSHFVVDRHTWIARNINNFSEQFLSLRAREDEGIVVKDPCACLGFRSNPSWSYKCRVPHKNYGF